jgi:hypothetical protein
MIIRAVIFGQLIDSEIRREGNGYLQLMATV